MQVPFDARQRHAIDQRRGLRVRRRGLANFAEQSVEAGAIAEFDAGGGAPLRLKDVSRQRNLSIARLRGVTDPALRPAQDIGHRHAGIGGDRDERRIGAILQQPPHQIGQEIAMAADRRIDAAGGFRKFGE